MHHLYLSIHNNAAALQQERESLVAWCEANGVKEYTWIEDNLTMGRILDKHVLGLIAGVQKGDTIVAADISRLGRSLSMLATIMTEFHRREVNIITLSGRIMEPNRTMSLFVNALNDIVVIEKDMKAYRSNEILFNMREVGAPIGRPRGSKKRADKNVLYGKEDTLRQMHSQGLSPAKIAAAVGVSRGTVYNYIVENKL